MTYGYDSKNDPETMRSFARQAYGHEMWIGSVVKEGGRFNVYGLYGHKLVADKPMPDDYALPVLYGDDGRLVNPSRQVDEAAKGWRFSFDDTGADVYTFYIDSNSTWVTDESGWHRGVKRDFSDVKYSGAFNMVAKRIISKDGVSPGSVMHATLEIIPSKAKLKVGEDIELKVFYEGKPLKNAKMICYHDGDEAIDNQTTDAEGVLMYPIKQKGSYAFIAKFVDENKKVDEEFDETAFTTVLTMETD
jgi:uncharacterized GH25 family protein